ncbi:pyridoxal-phosphate dependent enzyme [Nemorincola caseinilytica]|uniref:Pyridoxal-phosphate dependent enzyme n=1 Tax=Nemorincola caseinilytica TaxID=2054315 RepID=A0ABP8NJB1_9BACT
MAIMDERRAVIQPLNKVWYKGKVAALDMLRLDLLHPVVSGNKWYKLRLNLGWARDHERKTIVTFGGAFSNHLVATAFAAKEFGLKSVGIVRGRQEQLTPTLQECREYGMELIFVTREDYTNRHQPEWAEQMVQHFDEIYIVPEGGANELGRAGAGLLTRFVDKSYSHVALAVGTGTTMAGLRSKLDATQHILGFVPMKQTEEQRHYVAAHTPANMAQTWDLIADTAFGGFGKWNEELLRFMNEFYAENQVPLDVVYTGKMMYRLRGLMDDNHFSSCDRILCIHSGGLQGNVSVQEQLVYTV